MNTTAAQSKAQSSANALDFLTTISNETDFFDTVTYAKKSDLFLLKSQLESTVRSFGSRRDQLLDLCRTRLTQLRHCLETI